MNASGMFEAKMKLNKNTVDWHTNSLNESSISQTGDIGASPSIPRQPLRDLDGEDPWITATQCVMVDRKVKRQKNLPNN